MRYLAYNTIRSIRPIQKCAAAQFRNMSTSDVKVETTDIKTAPSVSLSDTQRTLVGSVLDLFAGRPSLRKLQLWSDDATFEDNITIAKGRKKYEAQWYGLQTAFSSITQKHHEVTSAGNPIGLDLKSLYVVKGINKEQEISSKVLIYYDDSTGKITKVQDKWGGELPESGFKEAMRKLNAAVVPAMVSVPKDSAEDSKRGN